MKRILEEASAPQEEAAAVVLTGLDHRFQMIRDFIAEQAQRMGHTFFNSEVTMRRKNGVPFTFCLAPK